MSFSRDMRLGAFFLGLGLFVSTGFVGTGASAQPGGEMPAGHPPIDPTAANQTGDVNRVLQPPALATSAVRADLPAGTIEITVVDVGGNRVPNAAVNIGTMGQGGERNRQVAETDQSGVATFADLPVGSSQAYRVNVPFAGATYSSTPFRLPVGQGFAVQVTRLPVTHDDQFVFMYYMRVIFEIHDERLKVIYQAQLTNGGNETYVFPADGLHVALPEGYTAFQSQAVMTDQRLTEEEGEGYVLRGSLPPGSVNLAWGFDLPIDATDMHVPLPLPLKAFNVEVICQATEGLSLSVENMPAPEERESGGNQFWVTYARRGPEEQQLTDVIAHISGLPRPGPARWVASGLASLLVLVSIFFAFKGGSSARSDSARRERRKRALFEQAKILEEEAEAGEIGPEYRQKSHAALVRELAIVLYEEDHSQPEN